MSLGTYIKGLESLSKVNNGFINLMSTNLFITNLQTLQQQLGQTYSKK